MSATVQPIETEDAFADAEASRRADALLRILVIAGIVIRVVQYLWRRSYWHDEAYLVLNVTSLSYRALVGPLPNAQSAPPAFLLAQKALFDELGSSEFVLRAIPLLFGIASLVLMAVLARRALGALGSAFAVALFALSDRLVAHAVEAKQYSGDVCFALVLLLVATDGRRPETHRLAIASVVAAAALWASHPVLFVFGGIALALLPAFARDPRGRARGAATFALCCLPAIASFVGLYFLSIRHQEVGGLYEYWAERFPDWSRPWMFPAWLVLQLIGLCRYPYEIGGEVVFALACCGAWALRRDRRGQLLGMLLAPIGLTLLASLAGRYPFGGSRVTLFLVPAAFLLSGRGVEWFWSVIGPTWWRGIGAAIPVIVIVIGLAQAAFHLVVPRHRGHIRPAAEFVRAQRVPGEPVYVIGELSPLLCYWREPQVLRPLKAEDAPHIADERFWVVAAFADRDGERKVESAMMAAADQFGPPRAPFAYRGGAAYQFVVPRRSATSPASPATRP